VKFVGFLGALFIRGLYATLRDRHSRVANISGVPQYVMAFWHAHLLLMLHSKHRKPIVVMSSRSRDGEIIARAYDWYDVEAVRGSSSKGASGVLRALIKRARQGKNIVFTPDGPRGPARVAKDGVAYAAQATGLPIVPVAFAAKKKRLSLPGTAWSCPGRSPECSISTASRSAFRGTLTSKSGGRRSRRH
jgi:lysophospholipid acyltransferase (LPLAT)-like uncharacterized protein